MTAIIVIIIYLSENNLKSLETIFNNELQKVCNCLRWLNTVLQQSAVTRMMAHVLNKTNKHGSEKSNGTETTISQNLLIKIL